jgi:NAD(P)-dependent dehydrogenase (short-subunit alcohol dehydrogenase family)
MTRTVYDDELKPPALTLSQMQSIENLPVLILGGSKGLGLASAAILATHGAKCTLVARTEPEEEVPNSTFIKADLSTIVGCRDLVRNKLQGQTFDTVICTMGIMSTKTLQRTSEGIEIDLAISYLSRFVILNEMIAKHMITNRKRIIIFGFPGNTLDLVIENNEDLNFELDNGKHYSQLHAHKNTVVLNDCLVHELAQRYSDMHVFGVRPGLIKTSIRDNVHGGAANSLAGAIVEGMLGLFAISPDEFARRCILPLVARSGLNDSTAINFNQRGDVVITRGFASKEDKRKLAWELTEKLIASKTA